MSKQRIIDEAEKLIIMNGVKATTMDDIAKYLGISKRTIYEHFKDKSELIETILDNAYKKNQKQEVIIFSESDNVLEGLLKILRTRKSSINLQKVRTALELKRYYPEIFNKMMCEHDGMQKLESTFEQGKQEGVFRSDVNVKTSAFLFSEQSRILFTEHFGTVDYNEHIDIPTLQIFEDLFLNFLRGISTQKGIEIIEKYISEK